MSSGVQLFYSLIFKHGKETLQESFKTVEAINVGSLN